MKTSGPAPVRSHSPSLDSSLPRQLRQAICPIISHRRCTILPKSLSADSLPHPRTRAGPVSARRRMDLATLIGYVLAWGALLYGMFHATHGHLNSYLNPAELMLVAGCALGAAMASMPLHSVMGALGATKKLLFAKETHVEHIIKDMVQYAETARRDGVLALETIAREAPDPFLRRGLQLTIDGTDPEIIERILRIEVEAMLERHKHAKHFWASVAKFGPGCGLVACLCARLRCS